MESPLLDKRSNTLLNFFLFGFYGKDDIIIIFKKYKPGGCPMMIFKVGDLAVYPAHGVGRIESIEARNLYGSSQNFYIMRILENNMIIMIPISNANNVGLREIIKEEEVSKIYKILKEKDVEFDNQSWNRRYREYMEKIKTGSVYEVAQVLRDLFLLKLEKELSFGERKMLDTAKALLVKEISIAKKMEETKVEENIKRIFKI
jgi:CarD family transcriptional regulator